MFLTVLDLILLFLIFLVVAYGFWSGFIQALGALIGVVIATWLTGQYYLAFSSWLGNYILTDSDVLRNTIAFIVLFAFISRAVGFLFMLADKLFNIISFIPFTKMINRLLGAVLGALEAIFGLGLIIFFVSQVGISSWLADALAASIIAQWLLVAGGFLAPLLPELLQRVRESV